MRRSFVMFAIAVAACPRDREPDATEPRAVTLDIAVDRAVAEVDPRFLSVAVDTAQVVGGHFWSPSGEVEGTEGGAKVPPFDFARPRLRKLAEGLSPAVLRIGGSAADRVHVDLSAAPAPPRAPFTDVLTAAQWDGAADFARAVGWDLDFTIAAGPGTRDATGAWQPDDVRPLLERAASRGDPVTLWELGNEVNVFPIVLKTTVGVPTFAADLGRARAALDAAGLSGRLGGSSSAFWPVVGEIAPILPQVLAAAAGRVDVVTWHYYPTQSRRCPISVRPAAPEAVLDPDVLDEMAEWADSVVADRDRLAAGSEVWLGESGGAQCGGEPGMSDRYADVLWWVDELGLAARHGQRVVVRQTLAGSSYGLLDDATLAPRPSYWASLAWKRLVGTRVLAVAPPRDPSVRAYAACGRDGGVVAIVENLRRASLEVRGPWIARGAAILAAAGLDSDRVELNGTPLALGTDDALPDTAPSPGTGPVELPPLAVGFITWPGPAMACR